MSNQILYFDHAATTPVKPEVLAAMLPWFTEHYGNPSSIYSIGRTSHAAIEKARADVAACIGASPQEIYFTSCGTEADNWAIRGIAYALKAKGSHIITSSIEHHAVLHTCQQLEKEGFRVTYIKPDDQGIISVSDVEKAICDDTILITIMFANNEIGTIQPISEIGKLAKARKILFHTDAVQAVGTLPIQVDLLGVDLLSMSAHKFYGPKGVGALYIRKTARKPQIFLQGGAQEQGRRGGTENVAGIVGLAKALTLSQEDRKAANASMEKIRDYFIREIPRQIPYCRLNGHPTKRLPGNVNFSFEYIEGESLLLMLDMHNIAASSGSACTSGSLDPSHVLLSIGLSHEIAHGSLRLSLGEENTLQQAETVVNVLKNAVQRLREMSPLYEQVLKGGNESCIHKK